MQESEVLNKSSKSFTGHQEKLEFAILKYQKALASGQVRIIDNAYKNVIKLYPPMMHLQEWYTQYHYLYDSLEDFQQDYIRIFCNVLSAWKPRNARKASRYDGTGEFKNYFIGALQHNYINLVHTNIGVSLPEPKGDNLTNWPKTFSLISPGSILESKSTTLTSDN